VQVDVSCNVSFDQTRPEDYDRVMGVNTKGPLLVTRAVAKVMKTQERAKVSLGRHGLRDVRRGCIVDISSAAALSAVATKTAYTTSKHALTGLTKAAGMYIYHAISMLPC
jgi:NAD(P)-dependent dehydrogenase (short-subunit alcohol dehydrogenase family)